MINVVSLFTALIILFSFFPQQVIAKSKLSHSKFAAISLSSLQTAVLQRQIASGMDDVEERSDGSIYTNSSDIEIVTDGGIQTVGLRFTDITIPRGAQINRAFIQFTTDETSSGYTLVNIFGERTNSASAFQTSSQNVSSRSKTNANVSWAPSPWQTVGEAGSNQRTPDLSSVVQEIVNRSGWQAGNNIAFIITGSGRRTAESRNGSSASAPRLTIEYSFDDGGTGGGEPPTGDTKTETKRITNGQDDVEERADGSMYLNSSDLELTNDGGDQTIGLRFTNLNIPNKATITKAYLQFTVDEASSEYTSLSIRGERSDNSGNFSSATRNVSNRSTTSASVDWQPTAWNTIGQSGSDQRSPDLSTIIQEIVDRGGWRAGNSMAFIISGSGRRVAESSNGSSSGAPLLHIEYLSDDDDGGGEPPTGEIKTAMLRISNGIDDVEERADGSMYLDSSDLELVNDGGDQTIGLRFTGLNIPTKAEIKNAYLQFTTDEVSTEYTALTIRGERTNNASGFSTSSRNVSSRSTTNAAVSWQPPAWRNIGESAGAQRTPDLSAVIQEIVNRDGWRAGNSLALIISGSGKRTAESANGSSSQAPMLVVEYVGEGDDDNGGGGSGDGIKIAFIGDTGTGSNFQQVLNLIKAERADLTVVSGDTSYDNRRDDNWDSMVRSTLGSDDPALISAGNHDYDDSNFSDVRNFGIARLNRTNQVSCSGAYAERMTCRIGNIYIVLSAIGSSGSRSTHEDYIRNSLRAAPANAWRICSWHKNQRDMQAGGKSDEVGWTAYETCRQNGAIIATGHEHSYSRTHLLSDMSSKTVASRSSTMTITEGRTIAFVSGLGGIGIRDQERSGNWWASIYTSTQGARYGALFGTFYDDRAEFYFKNINGQVIDRFTLIKGY